MAERVAESCVPLSVAGYENVFVDSIPGHSLLSRMPPPVPGPSPRQLLRCKVL